MSSGFVMVLAGRRKGGKIIQWVRRRWLGVDNGTAHQRWIVENNLALNYLGN